MLGVQFNGVPRDWGIALYVSITQLLVCVGMLVTGMLVEVFSQLVFAGKGLRNSCI